MNELVDLDAYDGTRECDECGRVTDAGEFPDWVNGVCEDCDPSIWDHPDNVERMLPADVLVEYTVGFYIPRYTKEDGTLDRKRILESWADCVAQWSQDGTMPHWDDIDIYDDEEGVYL